MLVKKFNSVSSDFCPYFLFIACGKPYKGTLLLSAVTTVQSNVVM